MEKIKVIFLYTELANYFLTACRELARQNAEVHIVRWPVNKEAPFDFKFDETLNIYERSEFDQLKLQELIEKINPDVLVCLGWIDKTYLGASIQSKIKGKKVIVLDNHWKGTLKQRLGSVYAKLKLVKHFNAAWVPGERQKKFALKMGFKHEQIHAGYYCADSDFFNSIGKMRLNAVSNDWPKRFIYIGRYYDFKGVEDLWNAFSDALKTNNGSEWELWCLGTGDIAPVKHNRIKHFGFVQPQNLPDILKQVSVLIIPSRVEPWAVVVHEMALSALPIIASDAVAAADVFVKNNANGMRFQAGNVAQLTQALIRFMNMSNKELTEFSSASNEIGNSYTVQDWAKKIKSFV